MIARNIAPVLQHLARQYPAVTVTGPRQSGKTTLVKALFPDKPYITLEDPDVRRYATTDPRGFLADFARGAIFDEIQRARATVLLARHGRRKPAAGALHPDGQPAI